MTKSQFARSAAAAIDPLLMSAIDEIGDRIKSGEPVDIEAYIQRFPSDADYLRQLVQTLVAVADLGDSTGEGAANVEIGPRPRQIGDFRVVREIARGGMGVVYETEQLSLDRRVALKVLPFAAVMDEKAVTRFKNEARAAATLDHPNIVPVYAVGNERGVYYYAMSFIDGRSVAQVMSTIRQRLPGGDPLAASEVGDTAGYPAVAPSANIRPWNPRTAWSPESLSVNGSSRYEKRRTWNENTTGFNGPIHRHFPTSSVT